MSYRLLKEEAVAGKKLGQEGIRPTVVVGLGGTGGDVLLKIRQKLYERYGSPSAFPAAQFVYIDTDTSNQHIDSRLLDEFKFSPSERVDAIVANTATYTANLNMHPLIKAWWYPSLNDLASINVGAGQIRAYSRLAFYVNFDKIKNAIAMAVQRAMASPTAMFERHRIQVDTAKGVYIYVVGSIAGGTGSGMFIDTGFLAKTLASPVTTVAYLVFPGVFQHAQERIFANGYSALKELEHFTFPENRFPYVWTPGYPPESKRPLPPPPYDYCYMVDNANATGTAINFESRYGLFEMVANNIFHDFGASDFAGHKRAVRVNLDSFLTNFYASEILDPQDPSKSLLTEAFTTRHSAFGLTSIQYPADRIRHACAARLGVDVMHRLATGKLPEMEMTKWVRETFFRDSVSLYNGKRTVQGRLTEANDLLDALYESDVPGKTLDSIVQNWRTTVEGDVKNEQYRVRNVPLSDYLRAEVERQLVALRDDRYDPDWQKWGDYSRTIRRNKENFLKTEILGGATPDGKPVLSRLDRAVADIVNDENKGIQFARMLLKEIRRILSDDAYPYLSALRREITDLHRVVADKQNAYQKTLAEIRARENEAGLKRLLFGKATMDQLTGAFFRQVGEYLSACIKLRARQEAMDICQRVLDHIGVEQHIVDEKGADAVSETGLLARLTSLEKTLKILRDGLDFRRQEFSKPKSDELTLWLYEPGDIDDVYYPRYLGVDESTRSRRVSEEAASILRALPSLQDSEQVGVRLMDLPELVARHGADATLRLITQQTSKVFETLTDDFEVLELFFKKFPNEPEQLGQLNLLYQKAQVWMHGSNDSNFKLTTDKRILLVGMYDDPQKPNVYTRFRDMLRNQISTPDEPEIGFFNLKSKNEVVFYTEAAGYPICYSQSVHDMRPIYDKLLLDRLLNLHSDRNEFRFKDILEITESERADLEQATEVFLLGLILGIIGVHFDDEDNVFYVEQRIGIRQDQRTLGTEHRAIRVLMRSTDLRQKIARLVRQREDELLRDPADWIKYYVVISYYQDQIYAPIRTTNLGKDMREQATTENLVLRKKLKAAEKVWQGELDDLLRSAADLDTRFEEAARDLGAKKQDRSLYAVRHTWASRATVDL